MNLDSKIFHDRSTIDHQLLGTIAERVRKQFLICPDNLPEIQLTVNEITKKIGLRYRIKATIRRYAGGGFTVLHLVKLEPKLLVTVAN